MLRFVVRAASKEVLEDIENRVRKLEFIFGEGANDAVREAQVEFLKDLNEIRKCLEGEMKQGGGSEMEEEVKRLREENARLKYRIEHLKVHLN